MTLRKGALAGGLCLLLPLTCVARPAGVWLAAGAESFALEETGDSGNTLLTEQGPRFLLQMGWNRSWTAWSLEWRGRLVTGNVDYDGQTHSGIPLQTTTGWTGTTQEFLAGYSPGRDNRRLELLAGLGIQLARRSIANGSGSSQNEDFFMGLARLGGRWTIDRLELEGGLLQPWGVRQNAHLDSLGFADNPTLHPRPRPSAWAAAAWRLNTNNRLILAYEGLRLDASPAIAVRAMSGVGACTAGSTCLVHQPETRVDRFSLTLHHRF
ncbi:MAG: hypothetical protein D6717_09450 [Gammaproteobacteria bacterium]|nr:MAG: hypothetical protein D6717_09450 [Gammaproteobacteria bacterium]